MDILKYALDNNLTDNMSAIIDREFRMVFNVLEIDTVVETGTYKGLSSAYMAQFVNKVHTFDITDYPQKYKIWQDCGVADKIVFHYIKNRDDLVPILKNIKYDFAFIDGEHTYEACKADFEILKECGRVLIHDVIHPNFKGIRQFADELGNVRIVNNNGYWMANK